MLLWAYAPWLEFAELSQTLFKVLPLEQSRILTASLKSERHERERIG
jgi:hypothetical protein